MNRITSIGLIAAAALAMSACTPVPSAEKNGTLVKLGQVGAFNSTWEAELVRGGSYTGGTGVQGAPFDFTVADPNLLVKAQLAFKNQQEVRIKYHKTWPAFWSSETGNFLDAIEVIDAREGGTMDRATAVAGPVQATGSADPVVVELLKENNRILKLLEAKGK